MCVKKFHSQYKMYSWISGQEIGTHKHKKMSNEPHLKIHQRHFINNLSKYENSTFHIKKMQNFLISSERNVKYLQTHKCAAQNPRFQTKQQRLLTLNNTYVYHGSEISSKIGLCKFRWGKNPIKVRTECNGSSTRQLSIEKLFNDRSF